MFGESDKRFLSTRGNRNTRTDVGFFRIVDWSYCFPINGMSVESFLPVNELQMKHKIGPNNMHIGTFYNKLEHSFFTCNSIGGVSEQYS